MKLRIPPICKKLSPLKMFPCVACAYAYFSLNLVAHAVNVSHKINVSLVVDWLLEMKVADSLSCRCVRVLEWKHKSKN